MNESDLLNKIKLSRRNKENPNYRGFGRLHWVENKNPAPSADKGYIYIKVLNYSNEEVDLLLTTEELTSILFRANRNKTDFPKVSLWVRFWDWLNK